MRCAPSVKGAILPAMTSYLSISTLPIYVASKKRGISFPMPLQLLSKCRPVNTVTKAGRVEPASRTPRSPPAGTDKPHPRQSPAGILAVGNSAAPVIDHDHIVFLDFHLLRPFCLGMVSVPSPLLLSVIIAMRHTSTLHNARLHAFSMELGSLGASSP